LVPKSKPAALIMLGLLGAVPVLPLIVEKIAPLPTLSVPLPATETPTRLVAVVLVSSTSALIVVPVLSIVGVALRFQIALIAPASAAITPAKVIAINL
jgi:hypothetical protein